MMDLQSSIDYLRIEGRKLQTQNDEAVELLKRSRIDLVSLTNFVNRAYKREILEYVEKIDEFLKGNLSNSKKG